jgi:hypothetical protein
MNRSVSSEMTGTSLILPLATIVEDIDDDSLEQDIVEIIDNDGKRRDVLRPLKLLLSKAV